MNFKKQYIESSIINHFLEVMNARQIKAEDKSELMGVLMDNNNFTSGTSYKQQTEFAIAVANAFFVGVGMNKIISLDFTEL
jgi:hypothetical protein